ncbi:MAG TPA: hypothetical protein VLM44_12725 [Lutibacter sp.]|nr:hypothetical protein [Lutibacter sp.]
MKDFKPHFKLIFKLGVAFFILIGFVFLGLYVFKANPSSIVKEKNQKIVAKDWVLKDILVEIASGNVAKDVEYGYRLLAETSKWMGPGRITFLQNNINTVLFRQ